MLTISRSAGAGLTAAALVGVVLLCSGCDIDDRRADISVIVVGADLYDPSTLIETLRSNPDVRNVRLRTPDFASTSKGSFSRYVLDLDVADYSYSRNADDKSNYYEELARKTASVAKTATRMRDEFGYARVDVQDISKDLPWEVDLGNVMTADGGKVRFSQNR